MIDFGRLVCRLGGLLGRLEASRSRLGLRLGPLLAPKMGPKTDPSAPWIFGPPAFGASTRPNAASRPPRPPKSTLRPPQKAKNDPQDDQK